MVNYISYAFDSIFYVMNRVVIPIPISQNHVYYFSLFSLFIALVVIGVAWFFFSKIFEIDFHFFRSKNENSNNSNNSYSSGTTERRRVQGRRELGNKR